MRRITACLLLAALMLGIAGCVVSDTPDPTVPVKPEPDVSDPLSTETELQTSLPETPPSYEDGFLFLTVSRLTFTLAGESEDIYIGSIPREDVTFGTDDESVALFENGVLTAVAPGETTAFAQYGDQRLECTVGCLAATEEELAQVDPAILRTAKRFPPEAGSENLSYFDDAAIVGDSIAYGMFCWNNLYKDLGNVLFLCRGGVSMYSLLHRLRELTYKGQPMDLDEALLASGTNKVFIMLGQNDVGFISVDDTMENWPQFLDMIRAKTPDIEIYLMSCIPEWKELYQSNAKNDTIAEHNRRLKLFAEEYGCHFIDLHAYAVDHTGRMPDEYNLDNKMHMNEAGCRMWMQLLRAYANYQTLKGEA